MRPNNKVNREKYTSCPHHTSPPPKKAKEQATILGVPRALRRFLGSVSTPILPHPAEIPAISNWRDGPFNCCWPQKNKVYSDRTHLCLCFSRSLCPERGLTRSIYARKVVARWRACSVAIVISPLRATFKLRPRQRHVSR